jgi:hypothetical protein
VAGLEIFLVSVILHAQSLTLNPKPYCFMTCCIDVAMGIELQGYLSTFHTLHVLLGDLFEATVQGLPLQASLFTQPCRDNTLYLLALVDELVMRDAFRILPVSPLHLFFPPPSFISMTTFRCMCARMDLSSCS